DALGLALSGQRLDDVGADGGEGVGQILARAFAERHQQDDGEHADDHAQRRQERAHLGGADGVDGRQKKLDEVHYAAAPSIRPSTMWIFRRARSATWLSCVTRTTVMPSWLSCSNSLTISTPVF